MSVYAFMCDSYVSQFETARRAMLHFTIGTGPNSLPSSNHLSLENDVRLLKASLLYADRIKLCSIGSSLTLKMLNDANTDPPQQLDFIEKHFRETVARDNPEEAATVLEFIRQYRQLLRSSNPTKKQSVLRVQYARKLGGIWNDFKSGWESFAYEAGIEEVLKAKGSGLVEFHEFSTGGVERSGGLNEITARLRSEEFYEDITGELFGLLSDSVSDRSTYPLFDDPAGELVRLGVEAKAIEVPSSNTTRVRHAGMAAHLLQRLPLFEDAPVETILDIRRELEKPLVRFRSAIATFSEEVETPGWEPAFTEEAEELLVREVEPAVLEIEERVRENDFIAKFTDNVSNIHSWSAGATLGMAAYNLASLPEIASLAIGGGLSVADSVRKTYKEYTEEQRDIQKKQLFFYYAAGQHLRTD